MYGKKEGIAQWNEAHLFFFPKLEDPFHLLVALQSCIIIATFGGSPSEMMSNS
jgi:hypothetical protein